MSINKKKLLSAALLTLAAIGIFWFKAAPQARADDALWNKVRVGGLDTIGDQAFEAGANPRDIRLTVGSIIKVFLGLMGTVFMVMILIAGFKYMTARGDARQVEEAVGQIRTGVIGLLIIMSAYGITVFVAEKIYNATNKF